MPDASRHARMAPMGFNPHRKYRAKPLDYVMVAAVFAVAAAMVIWAFLA